MEQVHQAVYGDYFLLSSKNENRVLLNIGGIANLTFLPHTKNFNEVVCTDIGAGNTLMDTYVQKHFANKKFDEDAALAKQGIINQALLNALYNHPFFEMAFPKTTGQELFNLAFIEDAISVSNTNHLSINDVLATLNFFAAKCIANAIKNIVGVNNYTVYVSGGGIKNILLMQHLQKLLPNVSITTTNALGINPNAKEAILFAVLANECLCGDSDFYTQTNTTIPAVSMGKISLPK